MKKLHMTRYLLFTLFALAFLLILPQSYGDSVSGFVISNTGHIAQTYDEVGLKNGPFLDRIVYKVIEGQDAQMLAIQSDEIDLIGNNIDLPDLPILSGDPDIGVESVLRNGYGSISINTAKYPFNITAFRRACAFAFDKNSVASDVWDGFAVPQDSLIPQINPFSIEGQLNYTYYDTNIDKAAQLLDDAGFFDIDADGFREASNGADFDVVIMSVGSSISIEVAQKMADALNLVHIEAVAPSNDFWEPPPYHHQDYDMWLMGHSFDTFDVTWIADYFWSENSDVSYQNLANWQNSTYDSWRDQLLHSTDFDDVYEAAAEMQKILLYECPEIVCYENFLLSAYRTDRFDGFVNDAMDGVPCWWTNYKVHLKEGQPGSPWGGTLRWGTTMNIASFNIMRSTDSYSMDILQMLYDSLMIRMPDGLLEPWLVDSYTIETHQDNPAVPLNNTRFTFEFIRNATWSDGTPVTAEDAAITLNYYRESLNETLGADLDEMTSAYSPTTYQLVVQFSTESYWHLNRIALKPILPAQLLIDLGPNGWATWSPDPHVDSLVTSGPFYVSDYEPSAYYELTYNPTYHHEPKLVVSSAPELSISSPSDLSYTEGEIGNEIVWLPEANQSVRYHIWQNDTEITTDVWSSGEIILNVDGLSPGTYEYQITMSFMYSIPLERGGHADALAYADDSVIVKVSEADSTTTTTTTGGTTPTTHTPFGLDSRILGITVLEWLLTVPSLCVVIVVLVKWRTRRS
ncbi:MAG: ABC transporter substrate-binding protein [Candidatus Thorarchaeota archaeon]